LILGFVGVAFGVAAAMLNPPKDLLEESANAVIDAIPREETAEKQFRAALFANSNTREHLLAVERYFPPEKAPPEEANSVLLANRKAWLQLGMILLADEATYGEAYGYFAKLETADDLALSFQVSGKAGMAIVMDHFESDVQVRRYLIEIDESGGFILLNEKLQVRIRELFEKYGLMVPAFRAGT
jgi:hypothetical protein